MDKLNSFLISLLANITTDLAKKAISALKASKTQLEDVEAVKTAVGIIKVELSKGTINLFGAKLEAFKSIQCDHGSGQLNIDRAWLNAAVLQTGGFKPILLALLK